MGLFRKRAALIPDAGIHGPWSIAEGEDDGKPLIVRVNEGLKNVVAHPNYKHQVGIAVPFRSANEIGFPSTEDLIDLDKLEDSLCAKLEQKGESLFAAVITTGGMREFVFYTSSPRNVKQKFEQLQRAIESHEIQLMIQEDEDWNVYKQFAG